MNKKLAFVIILMLALFQAECQTNNKALLKLATYTYSTNDRIDNLQPLARELEKTLEREVVTKSYPDVESFIDGIKANEVDIALINTLGYLILSRDNKHMKPIATLKVREEAVDNYKTVLLTNADSITDLKSLEDRAHLLAMLFVKQGSTSGNLVPRLLLSSIGINSPEEQFEQVNYGGDHTSTFRKLIDGKTDVCAIGSNEYFKQIQADSSLLDSSRLLWISKEIPLGPVLINKHLTKTDQKKASNLFLNLHRLNTDALESIKNGWSEAKQAEKFYPITDSYYDSFRMINGNTTDLLDILDSFTQ